MKFLTRLSLGLLFFAFLYLIFYPKSEQESISPSFVNVWEGYRYNNIIYQVVVDTIDERGLVDMTTILLRRQKKNKYSNHIFFIYLDRMVDPIPATQLTIPDGENPLDEAMEFIKGQNPDVTVFYYWDNGVIGDMEYRKGYYPAI